MSDLIDDYINKVESFSDAVKADAEDAAEKLESIASLPFLTWVDFSKTEAPNLSYTERIDGSSLPSLETTNLDYDLTSYDPNQYKTAQWDGEFFNFVLPIIEDQIENGGTGISTEVQNAIFDNMYERDLRTMNEALEAAESNVARRGFPLPSSLSQAARNKVVQSYQETRDNRSRDITMLIAERAQQSVLSLMDKGITIEKAQMDFAAGFAKIFLDIGNQILQKFRAEQEAHLAEFDGKVKVIMSNLEIAKMNQSIDLAQNEQVLKQWEIEASLSVEKTKALIQQAEQAANQRVSAAQGLVDFWASAVASANSQINAVISSSTSSDA